MTIDKPQQPMDPASRDALIEFLRARFDAELESAMQLRSDQGISADPGALFNGHWLVSAVTSKRLIIDQADRMGYSVARMLVEEASPETTAIMDAMMDNVLRSLASAYFVYPGFQMEWAF